MGKRFWENDILADRPFMRSKPLKAPDLPPVFAHTGVRAENPPLLILVPQQTEPPPPPRISKFLVDADSQLLFFYHFVLVMAARGVDMWKYSTTRVNPCQCSNPAAEANHRLPERGCSLAGGGERSLLSDKEESVDDLNAGDLVDFRGKENMRGGTSAHRGF